MKLAQVGFMCVLIQLLLWYRNVARVVVDLWGKSVCE